MKIIFILLLEIICIFSFSCTNYHPNRADSFCKVVKYDHVKIFKNVLIERRGDYYYVVLDTINAYPFIINNKNCDVNIDNLVIDNKIDIIKNSNKLYELDQPDKEQMVRIKLYNIINLFERLNFEKIDGRNYYKMICFYNDSDVIISFENVLDNDFELMSWMRKIHAKEITKNCYTYTKSIK